MVTAPMLHQGVSVALPKTATTNLPASMEDPSCSPYEGRPLLHQRDAVARGLLRDRLERYLKGRKDRFVLLKADRSLYYGTVVETFDLLNRMGIEQLGMVTDTSGTRAEPKR